jgi:dienelactone hydrolase
VNGGREAPLEGTWSTTLEWLVRRLAPRHPELGFVEVRYRVRSWRQLDRCIEDARAAVALATEGGAERVALVGFSMGGAVAVTAADHPAVTTVIGLAPWLPDTLPLDSLAGRRLSVVHGALDRSLPGVPGVPASTSRRAYGRAQRVPLRSSSYTLIRGGLHGTAVRSRAGIVPLPRAARWAAEVDRELSAFERGD